MAAASRRLDFSLVFGIIFLGVGLTVVECDDPLPLVCGEITSDMKMDTALLTISNDKSDIFLQLYQQSEECVKCNLIPSKVVKPGSNCSLLVDTRWPVRLEIRSLVNNKVKDPHPSCSEANLTTQFLQYGDYFVYIKTSTENTNATCSPPVLLNDPLDSNIPIYVGLGIAVFLAIVWILFKYLYRKGILHRILYFWSTEGMMVHRLYTQDLGSPTNINASDDASKDDKREKKERLRSLDTFRGISILIMVFVNYRAGYYWFFKHSIWNGLQLADLVFPWFVWIMGTSMVFSFSSQLKRSTSKPMMFWKILKRSAILFLLGLLINTNGSPGGVEIQDIRIPGVLQRFAGTYLITATIHMLFAKQADDNRFQGRWWAPLRDIIDYWPEWIINFILIGIWAALTFALHVPGCPTGYLGPGGLHDGAKYENCTGGAAGYIDRKIFGSSHIYQNPTAKSIYKTTVPYDPEGLLGTLTSCFMCFLGLQAGKILFIQKDWVQRCKRFIIWGIFLGIIATILSKGTKNDGWVPICKNLWSISFVVALSSFAFFLFCICYLLIDVWKVWSGAPFYFPGMNPIVVYVGHELFSGRSPVYFPVIKTHAAQLAMTAWGTFFWYLVAIYMYCKDITVTV